LIPVLLVLYGLAFPLGWLEAPAYQRTLELVRHPLTRIVLFVLCSLPLFHWAHRFSFHALRWVADQTSERTDQLFCYGGAIAGTVLAGYLLWNIA